MQSHAHEEELHRARDGNDANQALEPKHAARRLLVRRTHFDLRIPSLLQLLKVPISPSILRQLTAQIPSPSTSQQRKPPSLEIPLALNLELAPGVIPHKVTDVPQRRDGVDDGARHGHLREGLDGLVAVGLALAGVVPGEAAHDAAGELADVGVEFFGVEDEGGEEAFYFFFDVAVEVVAVGVDHGGVHPFALVLPHVLKKKVVIPSVRGSTWE